MNKAEGANTKRLHCTSWRNGIWRPVRGSLQVIWCQTISMRAYDDLREGLMADYYNRLFSLAIADN